ncbi:MCM DNA helicase complex subunit, partial [Chytridiales sp. JEL 0842]
MADRKRPRSRAIDDIAPSSPTRADDPPLDDEDENLEPFGTIEAQEGDEIEDVPLNYDNGSDDDGEDLFGSDIANDYKENSQLDRMDSSDIDDQDYEALNADARLIAEEKMRRRDREQARREGRLPAAFMDDEEDEDRPVRARRRHRDLADDLDLEDEDVDFTLSNEAIAEVRGPIAEYVNMEGPRQAIKRQFAEFLTSFTSEHGESVYGERIKAMCEANGESLEVSFDHLQRSNANLAILLTDCPAEMLKIFDVVAFEVVLSGFEAYDQIKSEIHVRITDLPVADSLRNLRQSDMNTLVRVSGVVTRRTGVFPQLKYVKYDCVKCGSILGPFYQDATTEISVGNCPDCQSKGPFNVNNEQTIYRNYQKITLQESPGSVTAGRLPRHKDVILLWDLVDGVRPGEEVEITGIYRNNFDIGLNSKNGFPVFAT